MSGLHTLNVKLLVFYNYIYSFFTPLEACTVMYPEPKVLSVHTYIVNVH